MKKSVIFTAMIMASALSSPAISSEPAEFDANIKLESIIKDKVNMCKMDGKRTDFAQAKFVIEERGILSAEIKGMVVHFDERKIQSEIHENGYYQLSQKSQKRFFENTYTETGGSYSFTVRQEDLAGGNWPNEIAVELINEDGHIERYVSDLNINESAPKDSNMFSVFFEQGYIGTKTFKPIDSEKANAKYYVSYKESKGEVYNVTIDGSASIYPIFFEIPNFGDATSIVIEYEPVSESASGDISYKYQAEIYNVEDPFFKDCELPLRK